MTTVRSRATWAFTAAVLGACTGRPGTSRGPAVHLVDQYKPELVEGKSGGGSPIPRTEWRFDGPQESPGAGKPSATRGFEAGPGVAELSVKDGRLVGRSTTSFPLVHVERRVTEDSDLLHEVEVRLRVSAGANLAVAFRGSEKLDLAKIVDEAKDFPWRRSSPLLPGDELHTYTLRTPVGVHASEIRHVLIRPTDVVGARFEIESVRLVFRKEHLASVPSGPGWQGLSEVYRETLVARAPETVRMKLTLPARPRLDLSLGTVEDEPVRFRVSARLTSAAGSETQLLERTLTRPQRWEEAPVDLTAFAGREVVLSLSLSSARPGTLGFWGAPTVRSGAARLPEGAPQGIILVWADTLRRDHLSLYGYPRATTPVLERLAADGTLFRDCVGQATWTKVATPSLMTSLYPTSHTVREFSDRLPASATTLASVFRDAGYATLSYSSILFTGRFSSLHRGFEEVHESRSLPDEESSKTSRDYMDRLLPWLEAHRDVPFFVFLHVADPHDPYRPRPPYDSLWADASRRDQHEREAAAVKKVIADPLLRDFGMPTMTELEKARLDARAFVAQDVGWYDGSIRAMDAELGRLRERLEGLGLVGRTLLVFTADHGEEFLDHGRMFHGQSVYGELTNLPLVFWRPGTVRAGAVVDTTVETIDIMPTLLEMSGLRVPPQAQGKSLVPLFGGAGAGAGTARADSRTWGARPAISEKAPINDVGGPPPRGTASTAIILDGYKLIHNAERPAGDPEFELYDHARDPRDQTDVSAEHPELVARLSKELLAWRRAAEAARLKPDAESAKALSSEDLERLRALGYIQ